MDTNRDLARRNLLLAVLPEPEFLSLLEKMELCSLKVEYPVCGPGQSVTDVYFPVDCIFSTVAIAGRKVLIETTTIGFEGVVGLPAYFGGMTSPMLTFIQVPGHSFRLPVAAFTKAVAAGNVLAKALPLYAHATMTLIGQGTACNATHNVGQRFARWILLTQDRVGIERFSLTHKFLGQMLGVRRASVSEAAASFQRKGILKYSRGIITVLERKALEKAACSCYAVIRQEFDRYKGFLEKLKAGTKL